MSNPLGEDGMTMDTSDIRFIAGRLAGRFAFKKFLADNVRINEHGLLVASEVSRALKESTDDDGTPLRPSEYMPLLGHLDKEKTGLINASDLVLFCARYIPQDPKRDDYTYEMRYLANILEYRHNNRNTANYLR